MDVFELNFCALRNYFKRHRPMVLCADTVWNSTLFSQIDHPELTKCFQYSLLCVPPIFFMVMAFLFYVTSNLSRPKKIMKMEFHFMYALRLLIQLFIAILFIVELSIDVYYIKEQPDILEIVSFIANAVVILFSIGLTEYRRKTYNMICPILFFYWVSMLISYGARFYSNVYRLHENSCISKDTYVSYLVMSGCTLFLIFISFLRECITNYSPSISLIKGPEPCPQQFSSILAKLMYTWLDPLILRWYRKEMNETNVFDLRAQEKCGVNTNMMEHILYGKIKKHKSEMLKKTNLRNSGITLTSDIESSVTNNLLQNMQDVGSTTTNSIDSYQDYAVNSGASKMMLCSSLMRIYYKDVLLSWSSKLFHDLVIFVPPFLLKLLIQHVADPTKPKWQGYAMAIGFLIFGFLSAVSENFCFFLNNCMGIKIRSALIGLVYRKSLKLSNEIRNKYTTGEIVNYMSVDAERIMAWAINSWFLFSSPLQITLCLFFLYNLLGYPMFAGLAVIIMFLPINGLAMKWEKKYSELELVSKDLRTKTLSEMFKGIKVLKMYAWEPSFIKKITNYRNEEVRFIRNQSLTWSAIAIVWDVQPFIVMLVTFMVYVYSSEVNYITAETAFVSLALFGILKMPMVILPFGIVETINAYISINRMSKYMVSDEIDSTGINHAEDPPENRSPTDKVIQINDGWFTWKTNDVAILQNLNLELERGKLVAIVGKIGAGKTSILSAILGEMTRVHGSILIKGSLAYVPQEAWIQNLTVRRNILFTKPHVSEEYERVLDACALRTDLKLLMGGDQTEIGERGINLSGGQKQRISLARAVYQDKDIYLLDDPLSAVDAHVGLHLFNKVLSNNPGSLLANKTRILVTHGIQWLPKVDEVIVVNNGTISERGSYKELMENGADFNKFIQDYLHKQFNESGPSTTGETKVAMAKLLLKKISQNESSLDEAVEELHNLKNLQNNASPKRVEPVVIERNTSLDLDLTRSSSLQEDHPLYGRFSVPESRKISEDINIKMSSPPLIEITETGLSSMWRATISGQNHVSSLESSYEETDNKKQVSKESSPSQEIPGNIQQQFNTSHNMEQVASEDQSSINQNKFKELGQLTIEEEALSGKVQWSTYWMYFTTWSYAFFFGSFFSYGVFAGSQVYGNMWLEKFTSDPQILNASKEIFRHPSLIHNYSKIIRNRVDFYMSYYGLIGFIQLIFITGFWVMLMMGAVRSSKILHSMLLNGIIHSPLSFFDTTPSGRLLNRFSRDMDALDHIIPFNIADSVACAFAVFTCLIVIAVVTPWFIAVIIPIFFIYFLAQHFYLPSTRQARRLSSIAASPIFNQFTETLHGASIIRGFREEKVFERTNQRLVDRSSTFLFIMYSSIRWMSLRLDIIGAVLVFFAAVFAVYDRENLTASLIGLSIAYSLQITDNLNWFVRQTTELETNAVAMERIREYKELPAEGEWDYSDTNVCRNSRKWPSSGRIQFINYGLRYREGLPLVLTNINLDIKSAEKIGVVGRTGAGKSSLIQALLRLVDPAATGRILIDGQDIAPLPLHYLRRSITVLPQDPLIFSGTIRENMDPVGDFANDSEKIKKALDQAHLLEWLEMKQKENMNAETSDENQRNNQSNDDPSCALNYECGEGGVNLSAGQRQLMCLARALLRESYVLILDEATASVDVETDELVMKTIRKCFAHCTVIIIAHRINTIMDCDRVIVLEKGEVIEVGNPRELANKKDSKFRGMARQMGEEPKSPDPA